MIASFYKYRVKTLSTPNNPHPGYFDVYAPNREAVVNRFKKRGDTVVSMWLYNEEPIERKIDGDQIEIWEVLK